MRCAYRLVARPLGHVCYGHTRQFLLPETNTMPITALFAGLLALIFIALSARVIGRRQGARVALGDAGDRSLQRRIRAHANFAEYTPIALIALGLAESLKAWPLALYVIGGILLFGRVIHAIGISREPETLALRVTGMVLTFIAIGGAAALLAGD